MRKLLVLLLLVFPAYAIAADIKPALKATFAHEGGYQSMRGDHGNWTGGAIGKGELKGTKYGIAASSYPKEDIKNLTIDRAAFIYKNDFWGASRCDEWKSQIIANVYFGWAVNQGQGTAARILQRAINYAGYPRPPIIVDGVIGRGTVARLNEVDQSLLFVHLVGLTHGRYIQIVDHNPAQMQFLDTWARRMKIEVQRSVHEYEAKRR